MTIVSSDGSAATSFRDDDATLEFYEEEEIDNPGLPDQINTRRAIRAFPYIPSARVKAGDPWHSCRKSAHALPPVCRNPGESGKPSGGSQLSSDWVVQGLSLLHQGHPFPRRGPLPCVSRRIGALSFSPTTPLRA